MNQRTPRRIPCHSKRPSVLAVALWLLLVLSGYTAYAALFQAPGVPTTVTVNAKFAQPTITNLNPSSAAVGASVTITGSGFAAIQGSATVTFNGTAVTSVTSWSALSLVVLVPSGATTGNVVVTQNGLTSGGSSFTVTGGGGAHWSGTVAAASCSTADVNTAIGTAVNGQIVTIPNGSCSWTTGITTTKQIWIRALNYTATDEGTCTRNVTLTNNSAGQLFDFTTGNSFHVGLSGITINQGSGTNNHLEVSGSGSKVPLISDMCLEVINRFGTSDVVAFVDWAGLGGVMWNMRFFTTSTCCGSSNGTDGSSFLIKGTPRAWETASTLGALDTNGDVNLYLEDSSCSNIGQFPDVDDHGRFVSRHNDLDGCWGVMHAFTSDFGGRHWEFYNNVFRVTNTNRNMAGRYTWMRGGHGIYTDNVVNTPSNTSEWGNSVELDLGESNENPSQAWPQDRQVGVGHNGSAYVQDPVYLWNETGGRAHTTQCCQGTWSSHIMDDRDYFTNNGAKPSYSKYTYPHPLRAGVVP